MARLNTHLSATPQPQPGRSSTVDSLYRDPTPQSRQRTSTARASSYSVMSPAPSTNSDKENTEPESRDNTPRPPTKALRARRQMAAPRLPTPSSGSSASGQRNKRRRTGDYNGAASSPQIYVDEDQVDEQDSDVDEDVEEGVEEDDVVDEDAGAGDANDDDEDEATKFYDPQQKVEDKRNIRVSIRNNQRRVNDQRDELVKPGNTGLLDMVQDSDRVMGKIKQTDDAALDARLLVQMSELATKQLDNSIHGNAQVGLDIDQFVSRCIFFMKNGGNTTDETAPSATQARNRRQTATQAEDDDDDDAGDGLDWAVLGREACFPCNRRPAVSSFLLGPLSVQKRMRATTSRRGKSQRQPTGPATRPQELTQADLQQSENSNLTHVVKGIRSRLEHHIETATQELENQLDESATELEIDSACRQQRVYQTPVENEAAVSLFDFVVNPNSFGQTVENIFYTSFLIKEGNLKVLHSEEGLPLLIPCEPYTIDQQREQEIQKHQAIFSIDYPTWQKLIQAFDIKEPLIPHRAEEESQVTSGGWYG